MRKGRSFQENRAKKNLRGNAAMADMAEETIIEIAGMQNLPESRTANTAAQNPQEDRTANSGIQMAQDVRKVNNAGQKIPANRAVNLSRTSIEMIIEAARKFQPRNQNFRRNHFLLLRLILHTMATGAI